MHGKLCKPLYGIKYDLGTKKRGRFVSVLTESKPGGETGVIILAGWQILNREQT